MAWSNKSGRTSPLPRNWKLLRGKILKRDGYQCTHIREDSGQRCIEKATDVDHGDLGPNNHTNKNLRSLCSWHHNIRTGAQGGAAAAEKRRQARRSSREEIPGIILLD